MSYNNPGSRFRGMIFIVPIILIVACAAIFTASREARAIVPSTGPVLHIKFNQSSGSIAPDSSGNGHDGTIQNGASFAAGKFGNAVSLDGSTQYVSVPSADALQDSSNGFSVCAWGNLAGFSPADGSILVAKEATAVGSPSQDPWTLWEIYTKNDALNDATYPTFAISNGNPGGSHYMASGSKIPLNSWFHLCGVYDPSDTSMKTYLNGELNVSEISNVAAIGHNSQPVVIGAFGATDFPDYFNGMIDDVRIYNRALSAADVAAIYDPSAPTITLNGAAHASTTVGTPYSDPGAVATDALDGTISFSTSTDPIVVDFGAPGTFTITYSATNSSDLTATASRIVDIIPAPVSTTTATTTGISNGDDDGITLPPNTGTTTATTTTTIANGDDDGVILTQTSTTTSATTTTTVANGDDDGVTLPPVVTVTGGGQGGSPDVQNFGRSVSISTGSIGGGSTGGTPPAPKPQIALANIPPAGEVLGASTACSKYLFNPLKYGDAKDADDVIKLQALLNEVLGTNIPLTGFFGESTKAAVDAFQLKYKTDILDPWIHEGFNLSGKPTGVVGPMTLRVINNLVCPDLQIPMPSIQ